MNLGNVIPKCVPSGNYQFKGFLSDDFGSVMICYDDGTGSLLRYEDLRGLDTDEIKRKAWNNLRTEGCRMTDIYKENGAEVTKPPVYSVKTPFVFDIQSLSWIAKVWNEEVFYIMPATTDEALLLAGSEIRSGRITEEGLKKLARRANNNLKAATSTEILTEDIYCYERERGTLKMI